MFPQSSAQGCVLMFSFVWPAMWQAPCTRDFLGKSAGMGCHFLLQGLLSTRGWTHISRVSSIASGFFMLSRQESPLVTRPSPAVLTVLSSVFLFFLRVSHCCNILSSATQKKFSFGPTYSISYCFIFLLPYVAKFFKIAVYSLYMVAFFINLLQEGLCSITAQEHLLLASSLILCC